MSGRVNSMNLVTELISSYQINFGLLSTKMSLNVSPKIYKKNGENFLDF